MVATIALGMLLAGSGDGEPCRSGKIAAGFRCDPCGRVLQDVDMRDGLCKRCDGEPRRIEYCVRRLKPFFVSSCVHRKRMSAPFRCCGKIHRLATVPEDRARLTWSCRACGAKADARADLRHKETCDNAFAVDRACLKSGIAPHVK
jgi:hypothetical protein